MKRHLKNRFTFSDLILIVVNIVPVWGVWFEGWRAVEVFLVYCIESVIIGGFNILKMLLTTFVKKRDVWENQGSTSLMSGYFFIFFFIFHYGLFVFIQMNIFLGTIRMGHASNIPEGVFEFLFHFTRYLSPEIQWLLLTFVVSYALQTLKDFVFTGYFKNAEMMLLMFQPYPRIFVQQFVVIIGGFALMLGAGKLFILIFAVVKIFFEVMIDYERMLRENKMINP